MMRKLLSTIFCLGALSGFTQNTIALPEIINYPKQVYNAGTQNWKIVQDKKGIIYAANDEGLLSFDGSFWKRYTLQGGTGVRSVAVGIDGRILLGSQGEIGYFEPGRNGNLQYHSLNDLVPE